MGIPGVCSKILGKTIGNKGIKENLGVNFNKPLMLKSSKRLVFWIAFFILPLRVTGSDVRELSVFDTNNRFLEGKYPSAKLVPSVTLIDSFEDFKVTKSDWRVGGWVKIESVREYATDGKYSLKVVFTKSNSQYRKLNYVKGTRYWGGKHEENVALSSRIIFNDEVRLDVYNPGRPLQLIVNMGKEFRINLTSGKNEVVLKTKDMIKDVYRITTILQNTTFGVKGDDNSDVILYFDNFRWIGPGIGENLIKYARCFDFGSDRYCRPYFSNVDSTTGYTKDRGFGWEHPNTKYFEHTNPSKKKMVTEGSSGRQPHDELIRDRVFNISSPFFVDLPDGKYRVHVVEGHIGWGTFFQPTPAGYNLTVLSNNKKCLVRYKAKTPEEILRYYYGYGRKR